jgi:exportin-7
MVRPLHNIFLFLSEFNSFFLASTGKRVLQLPKVSGNEYKTRYKGIAICFKILQYCLNGDYVNFSIFGLYGDPALNDAVDHVLSLMISIPLADLVVRVAFSFLQPPCGFTLTIHFNAFPFRSGGLFVLVQAYPKLADAFYSFVAVFSLEHLPRMTAMDSNVFLYIMSALAEGLRMNGEHGSRFGHG